MDAFFGLSAIKSKQLHSLISIDRAKQKQRGPFLFNMLITFCKLFLLLFAYSIFFGKENLAAEAVTSCSCGNLSNPFNISNSLNETISFSNPFNKPCPDSVLCIWYFYREVEDPNYVIEISLKSNFSQSIYYETVLDVFYCNDSIYNNNNSDEHLTLINNYYQYYAIRTTENLLCVRFRSQGYYAHEFWEVQFKTTNAPIYLVSLFPN
jgi:hypothetical protein